MEMSDHEGFEMLDATFGVREASEASSDESPNSPHVLGHSSPDQLQLGHTGSLEEGDCLVRVSGGASKGAGEDFTEGEMKKKAPGEGSAPCAGSKRVGIPVDVVHPSAGLTPKGYKEFRDWGGCGGGDGCDNHGRSQTGTRFLNILGVSNIGVSNSPVSASPPTLRDRPDTRLGSAAAGRKGATGQDANAITTDTTINLEGGYHPASAARDFTGGKRNPVQTNNPAGGGGADEVMLTVPRASTLSVVTGVFPVKPASQKGAQADDAEERIAGKEAPEDALITHSLATTSPFLTPPAVAIGKANQEHGGFRSTSPAATASASGAEDEAVMVELLGMGFDCEHVVRVLKECGRGESWKEAAISLLLEPQVSTRTRGVKAPIGPIGADPGDRTSACPICLSDIQAGEAFTVDCEEQHTFCVDCLHSHCSVQLLDSGLIPACPLSNMACGHELSQEEVERVFLLQKYSAATDSCRSGETASGPREGGEEQEADKRALDTCRTLLTRRGLESTGAIPCVSPNCGNWMVHDGGGQRVKCSSCLVEFCGRCKRSPYHYTVDCDGVIAAAREWSSWLTEGKAVFLEAMAARDDEHKALLNQHNIRKQEHDCAVKEAERLRLEYDRMEDWKEMRCRRCPGCGRTIEKLSGCDLMVCGVDAHGGNVQNGCGVKFMWGAARPYRGDRGERKMKPFIEVEPAAAARSKHFIADGIALRCDRCHRDVIGPLFRCVHCPSFACCLECQDMACRDPRHVHHTFQVVNGDKQESPSETTSAAASGGVPGTGSSGNRGRSRVNDAVAMDADDLA